jgi:regulator of protease activity HflC (stomatin/prohibitin superfamily)
MLFTITIEEGQRALLFHHGRLLEYLGPGKHRRLDWTGGYRAELLRIADGVVIMQPQLDFERLVPAREGVVIEVSPDHAALVTIDDRPLRILRPGKYLLWQVGAVIEAEIVDLEALDTTIPERFRHLAGAEVLHEVRVQTHQRGLLYVDGVLTRVVEPGRHGFSPWNRLLRVELVDLREKELQVTGQELVTRDKVTLRLNLLLKYRIADPVLTAGAVESVEHALYAEMQIAARNVVAGVSIDELLEQRATLAKGMVELVQDRVRSWGVDIVRFDLKDVVLPGEMKTLLNQVIEAEKRAAAQVILRREEVAATRSLANTARLLESNPVLLRLKELETLKDIVERIPQLTVVLGGDELPKHLRIGIPPSA